MLGCFLTEKLHDGYSQHVVEIFANGPSQTFQFMKQTLIVIQFSED